MKRFFIVACVLVWPWTWAAALSSRTTGAGAPAVKDIGLTSTGTITSVMVTTTTKLAYSTGTVKDGVSLTTSSTWGQYMPDRTQLEFFNDTSTDVWVGFEPYVSTQTVDSEVAVSSAGRRLVPGETWAAPGNIKDFYVKSGTTTRKSFQTIQAK